MIFGLHNPRKEWLASCASYLALARDGRNPRLAAEGSNQTYCNNEEGLIVRIIVRPAYNDVYEILAGHNRVNAAKLAGWSEIPAEVVEADDARAIVIATSTNLIQWQELSIIERGKAYRALLDAKNLNSQRNANVMLRYRSRPLSRLAKGITPDS